MHNAKRQLKGDEVKKTARGLPQVMSLTSTQSWLRDLPSPKAGLSPAPKMGLRPPPPAEGEPTGEQQGTWLGLGEPYVGKEATAACRDSRDADAEGGCPCRESCLPFG